MTISSETRKAGPYTGNGLTTSFSFAFKVFTTADVLVVRTDLSLLETTLTLNTDYSVTLNSNQDANPGGTVTLPSALTTGFLLTLSSQVGALQATDLTNQGGFYPSVLNTALDKLTILVQQLKEQVGRAVKTDISSSITPAQLIATLTTNAANAVASAASAATSAANALASKIAAAASAAAALVSQNSASSSASSASSSAATATTQAGLATTNGAAQVSLATTQANNASTSATNSANSATAAAASAAAALTSKNNAATSETNAGNSASSAATSATSAAAQLTSFKNVYYGPLATNPTTRPDSSAMQAGDEYYNTSSKSLQVYNGTSWGAAGVVFNPIQQSFSGNGSTTAFTLSQAPGVVAALLVSIGGVNQVAGTDYTISGTTLTFTTAPVAGTNNINTVNFGVAGTIGVPANASITNAMLQSGVALSNIGVGGMNASYLDANSQFITHKNKLINGNFDVWQRGQSFGAAGMASDRWYVVAAGTTTHSRESTVVPSGSRYSHKWTTSAASSYGQIYQYLETATVVPMANKVVIASAMVQCSAGFAGNAAWDITYTANGDTAAVGGWTVVSQTQQGQQVVSSGFTKITTIFTVPVNALGLRIGIVPTVAQASGVSLYHGQIQLELGSIATTYDFRLLGTEILHCQRFFEKTYDLDTPPASITAAGAHCFVAINSADTYDLGRVRFLVPKRTTPTITTYSPTNGATSQARGYSTNSDRNCYTRTQSPLGFEIWSDNWSASDGCRTHWIANAELA